MKKNKKVKPEIQNWYKDRYQRVVVQRKLLGVTTLASLALSFVLALVIVQLVPLKTIEPYVIQIDSKTGITQTVDPVTAKELTANEAVNNYFIVQYIRAREGYDSTDLVHNYDLVRLMSEDRRVYSKFMDEAGPNNPQSNIARLGTYGIRTVKFKSITYHSPQVVQIRVLITEKPDKIAAVELHRIVLLSFEYVKMNLTNEERYLNPLGFRVTDYQINEDSLQQ